MDIMWISDQGAARPRLASQLADNRGFLWIDDTAEALLANPDDWRAEVERLTGIRLHDLHLEDAANPAHPSYFDNTPTYEMVVFRRLSHDTVELPQPMRSATGMQANLDTQPVGFFVLPHALVTVRHGGSATCDEMKRRLADLQHPEKRRAVVAETRGRGLGGIGGLTRIPAGPAELMLRLLSGMVDRYLALRQPLTQQLDRWQRELLNPSGRFRNWLALLDARIVLRRLENICEEQHDALSELRDAVSENSEEAWGSGAFDARRDSLLVRLNDVMEHVARVLNHARRMEVSVENAVQLHFSATAHRTNEIMRILTVVTVIFMPLTLITGIFGMNFDHLPIVHHRTSFWWVIGGMFVLAMTLWTWFAARRFLETRPYRVAEALARRALRNGKNPLRGSSEADN